MQQAGGENKETHQLEDKDTSILFKLTLSHLTLGHLFKVIRDC